MTGILEGLAISAATSLITAGLSYALSPTQKIEGQRLQDLSTGKSNYGAALPWCWGKVRVGGNLAWSTFKEEVKKTEKQGKGAKVESTTYKYYGSFATIFSDCRFRPVVDIPRLWMNKKLVYSKVGGAETIAEGGKFADLYLRFYYGGSNQLPDPLLQTVEPISNYNYGLPRDPAERDLFLSFRGVDPATADLTPAYNYRSMVVAERLPLEDFHNSLPQLQAEVIASDNCNLAQIFGDIFGLFYDPARLDLSLIDNEDFKVEGYFINSISAAKQAIQNLQKAYFVDIISSNGIFKFIPLNHARTPILLKSENLAAHQKGTQKPFDYQIKFKDKHTLPSKVEVNYIDPDLNYDQNTQTATHQVQEFYNENKLSITFNLVMTATQAASLAFRLLYLALLEDREYEIDLPPAFLDLEATDLLVNIFDDLGLQVRINQIRLGANFGIKVTGVPHDAELLNHIIHIDSGVVAFGVADPNTNIPYQGNLLSVGDDQGTTYTEGTDYTVDNNEITVLAGGSIPTGSNIVLTTSEESAPAEDDLGTITSGGDTNLQILDIPLIKNSDADYTLYLTGDGGPNWTGANLYISIDNSRFTFLGTLDTYGIFGTITTNWDGTKTTVQVNYPELESVSTADLGLGFNLALIGNQILQYQDAVLVGANTYELSNINFGLRGTEQEPTPVTGDRFVLLQGDNAILARIVGSSADIGQTRYFKAVSNGQALDEVASIPIVISGLAQRPYAPNGLSGIKDSVGNITLGWLRRDRHGLPNFSEVTETYSLEILDPADDSIKRSVTVSQEYYFYSEADQIADFGSLQTDVKFKVAQVSADVGNGPFQTATVTPAIADPPPIINSFNPVSATIGDTVTVYGNNLSQLTAININGLAQDNLTVVDNSEITFDVAETTQAGLIELLTTGGTTTSNQALIVTAAPTYTPQSSANPQTLPYTIDPADVDTEIIITAQTDLLKIPDLATGFDAGWFCLVSLDGVGTITIQREDNTTTDIKGVNTVTDDQTVKLWHRGGNIWKID